jgi:hypothetical protein
LSARLKKLNSFLNIHFQAVGYVPSKHTNIILHFKRGEKKTQVRLEPMPQSGTLATICDNYMELDTLHRKQFDQSVNYMM